MSSVLFCLCFVSFIQLFLFAFCQLQKEWNFFRVWLHKSPSMFQFACNEPPLLCNGLSRSPCFREVALSSVLPTPSLCLSASQAASLTLNSRKWFLTSCHSLSFYYSLSIYQNSFPDPVTTPGSCYLPHSIPLPELWSKFLLSSSSFFFF